MHGVAGAAARAGTDEGAWTGERRSADGMRAARGRWRRAAEASGGHRPGLHPEPRQVARHGAGSPGVREERELGGGRAAHRGRGNAACEYCVCNGGRARCPYRAARVMRVRNGGAIMTSRRVRGPAAHRAAGGEPPLASRGMQNSQRVHDAKPRTAVASRHGQWRGGAMGTSRPTAKPHEGGRTATGREG